MSIKNPGSSGGGTGSGTITGVTAGANLTGGGTTGTVTIALDPTQPLSLTNVNFGTGSGSITSTGTISGGRVLVTSATLSGTGIFLPGANILGFMNASTLRGEFDAAGQFRVITIGAGLSIAEGTNAKMGVATLVGGTVVISTTAITALSRVQITGQSLGTVTVPSAYGVSARTAGTSFTILASQATDTSIVGWLIVEPS